MGWTGYGKLWGQVLRSLLRPRTEERFELTADVRGGEIHARLDAIDDDDQFVNGLTARLVLSDPTRPGEAITVEMHQVAAGRYEAKLLPPSLGAWLLEARHESPEWGSGVARTTVSVPYPAEHLTDPADRGRLERLALQTGGVVDPAPAAVWAGGDALQVREPLWPYLALLAVGLFLLDVAFRRVRPGRRAGRTPVAAPADG